jgi:carbon-monoxide dehydrogenase medium subunit
MVAEAARRWGGSIHRNRATVGGAIAIGAPNDPLLVALLACDAVVTFETLSGCRTLSLARFWPVRAASAEPAVIIKVSLLLDAAETPSGAAWALAAVARTPADAPIVVVAAMLAVQDGLCSDARLAIGGVAPTPVVLPEITTALVGQAPDPASFARAGAQASAFVRPAGDFRGSAEYRQAMAGVLAERALGQAWRQGLSQA